MRPLRPPSHPTVGHQQVTRHQLKLLIRGLANWEERAEVWFKPQRLLQQPRFLLRSHKQVVRLGPRIHTLLSQKASPSSGVPAEPRAPRCHAGLRLPPEGSASPGGKHRGYTARRPPRLIPSAARLQAPRGTPGGSAREHLLLLPSLFKQNTPSSSRGDALYKETSMHRAREETKINSKGCWLLRDPLHNQSLGLCCGRSAQLLPIKPPLPLTGSP